MDDKPSHDPPLQENSYKDYSLEVETKEHKPVIRGRKSQPKKVVKFRNEAITETITKIDSPTPTEGDSVGSYSLNKLPFLGKAAITPTKAISPNPASPGSMTIRNPLVYTSSFQKVAKLHSNLTNLETENSNVENGLPAIVKSSKELSETNSTTLKFNNLHIKYTDFFPLDVILVS